MSMIIATDIILRLVAQTQGNCSLFAMTWFIKVCHAMK